MTRKEKLLTLYHQGLEYQKQLDAVKMAAKFYTAKELPAHYELKSGCEYRLDENTIAFEELINELNND